MDADTKRRILREVSQKLAQTAAQLAAQENAIQCQMRDTDLSSLQPLIGDHIMFSLSGVILLEDYVKANPDDLHINLTRFPGPSKSNQ
jgi:hypothetical protein